MRFYILLAVFVVLFSAGPVSAKEDRPPRLRVTKQAEKGANVPVVRRKRDQPDRVSVFVPFLARYLKLPQGWVATFPKEGRARLEKGSSWFTLSLMKTGLCNIPPLSEDRQKVWGDKWGGENAIKRTIIRGVQAAAYTWTEPDEPRTRHWCVEPEGRSGTTEAVTLDRDRAVKELIEREILIQLHLSERRTRG